MVEPIMHGMVESIMHGMVESIMHGMRGPIMHGMRELIRVGEVKAEPWRRMVHGQVYCCQGT